MKIEQAQQIQAQEEARRQEEIESRRIIAQENRNIQIKKEKEANEKKKQEFKQKQKSYPDRTQQAYVKCWKCKKELALKNGEFISKVNRILIVSRCKCGKNSIIVIPKNSAITHPEERFFPQQSMKF